MSGRRRGLVVVVAAAAMVVSGLVSASPASAATVGLTPVGGSPVELGEQPAGGVGLTISLTNGSASTVILDHANATSDDPTVYFHSESIGALGPGSAIASGQTVDLLVSLNASRPGSHDLTLDLGDSVVGEWPGTVHQWSVPVHVTITGTTTSTTSLTGPGSAVPGDTVELSGTVSDPAGVLPGATVTLSRSDGDGVVALPSATTDGTGAFATTLAVGSTDVVVTASFSDSSHSASSAQWTIASTKVPSTLTVVAPASVVRGTSFAVSGILTNAGVPVAGAQVSVLRRSLLGSSTVDLLTAADGSYSFSYTATVGGPHTFTASWAGDATRAPVAATGRTDVPRTATAVSIRTSATRYAYGAYALVTVRLGATYTSRVVSVYARPLGTSVSAPGVRIAKVVVKAGGTVTVRYRMMRRTTLTAVFAGDYRTAPASRAVTAEVLSTVTLTMLRPLGRSGAYLLYHRARTIAMQSVVRPSRPYGCVVFVLQRLVSRTWRTVDVVTCAGLSSASALLGYAYSDFPRGTRYRIRAGVAKNSYSSAAVSPWRYFQLV